MIKESSLCSGCSACLSVCSVGAISFFIADDGFMYPKIDSSKCISCGSCSAVCQLEHPAKLFPPNKSFTFSLLSNELAESSSGGVAFAVAEYAIKVGMVVYGVSWDENMSACHERATTLDGIKKFQKSKYVKPKENGWMKSVLFDLKSGKDVISFGLPCENFGLGLVCSRYREHLLLIDLFCGGVPSDLAFHQYLQFLKFNKKLIGFDFRSKQYGSDILCSKAVFADGSCLFLNGFKNSYVYLVGSDFVRYSCLTCSFHDNNSSSDLKIGDYFGLKGRGDGLSLAFVYDSQFKRLQEILDGIKKLGSLSFDSLEETNKSWACRKLNKNAEMENVVKLDSEFAVLSKKSFKKAFYRYVYKKLGIKTKIYFYLPYFLKKKLTK